MPVEVDVEEDPWAVFEEEFQEEETTPTVNEPPSYIDPAPEVVTIRTSSTESEDSSDVWVVMTVISITVSLLAFAAMVAVIVWYFKNVNDKKRRGKPSKEYKERKQIEKDSRHLCIEDIEMELRAPPAVKEPPSEDD